ncbi:MAG: hypothetical protein SGCHY_002718 [Lobulomycetales sp.]
MVYVDGNVHLDKLGVFKGRRVSAIRARGATMIARGLFKFWLLTLLIPILKSPDQMLTQETNILDNYTHGAFFYLVMTVFNDVRFGATQIFTLIPQNDMFNAPFLATRIVFRFRGDRDVRLFSLLTFLVSGLIHEYICWASFRILQGRQLLFFLLSGLACLVQGLVGRRVELMARKVVPVKVVRETVQILATGAFFGWIGGLFIHPYMTSNLLRRTHSMFSVRFPWAP